MMDSRRLPGRALVDSGLVTRAMGDLPPDAETPMCKEFYEAMLSHGRELLIAAPTIAEVMRQDGKRSIPRVLGIEVVSFDDQAAQILGRMFPANVLKSLNHGDTTLTHLKYDALIMACAVRHNADCVVAIDDDFVVLGKAVGMPVYRPNHFAYVRAAPLEADAPGETVAE
jgi:predicted nucleic acid-binding protein